MTLTEDVATQTPAKEDARARRREEDARLITGRTRWTDNMVLPGMLHMAVLRSPVAHARITGIDVSVASRRRASSPSSPGRTSLTSRARCPVPGRSPPTWSAPVTGSSPDGAKGLGEASTPAVGPGGNPVHEEDQR